MGGSELFASAVIWMKSKVKVNLLSTLDRLIQCVMTTKGKSLSVNGRVYHPFISTIAPRNAIKSASVTAIYGHVLMVYSAWHITKIFDLVVHSVSINMIDFVLWHFASFQQPNNSMNFVERMIYVHNPISQRYCARFLAYFKTIRSNFTPKESSCSSTICKEFLSQFKGNFHNMESYPI